MKRVTKSQFVFMKLCDGAPREVYAGLLWIQRERGYKDGWVAHKFREVFGGWPRPQTPIKPEQPTAILVEWLGIEKRRWQAKKKREERRASEENTRVNGDGLAVVEKGTESTAQPTVGDNPHAIDCACWECIVKLQYSIMVHHDL